jgi:hypothetical protein
VSTHDIEQFVWPGMQSGVHSRRAIVPLPIAVHSGCGATHAVVHEPQRAGSVRSASQPSLGLLLQSPRSCAQTS